MKHEAPRITAAAIQHAMRKNWPSAEWAILWEVADGTGASARRYADAVMMSLWPSRGLELHGVEIKVSRSDWQREAKDPEKAERVARFCDRWWIHAAPGVVHDISEVPPAWGLRVWDGARWKTMREADKREAEPMTRAFLASLLRRGDGMHQQFIREAMREAEEETAKIRQQLRDGMEKAIAEKVERRTRDLAEKEKQMAAFEAAFGGEPRRFLSETEAASWGRAARSLSNVGAGWGSATELAGRLRKAADDLDAFVALSQDFYPEEER